MTALSSDHPLHKRINEIFHQATPALFIIDLSFSNMHNETFSLPIEYIDRVDIFDEFAEGYMENIEVEFRLNVPQYQELLKNYTDLKCFFAMYFYDEEKNEKGKLYYKESYQALIKNMKDITHTLPQSELYDAKDKEKDMTHMKRGQLVDVKMQLIKPDIYKLSKLKMNTILPKATVEQAIWAFLQAIKVAKCCMIPPDDKMVYPNLTLPPLQSMASIFKYLQNTYGVYDHDGNLYYHNGKVYIYPTYVTEGRSDDTFHIYKAPSGYLLGAKGTTIFEEKDAFMFTNQLVSHKVTAVKSMEDHGNSIFTINSAKMIDGWAAHSEKGSAVDKGNPDIFNASLGKGAVENSHTPVWSHNPNNECLMKSKLARLNVSVLDIGWVAALPFIIKPFQKMMFHYEKGNKQQSVSCTCPSAAYCFVKQARMNKPIFSVQANLKIFVPNGTDGF